MGTLLPDTVALDVGVVMAMLVGTLTTVKLTGCEVTVILFESMAIAVNEWLPLSNFVVSSTI